MAMPAPFPQQMAVVGPQYCAPYPVDLTVTRKAISLTDGDFAVTDANGNVIMKVRGKLLSLRDRRVLLDAAGNPIISMQQKIFSAHRRWQAYRGDSSNSEHLLFSVKKSSLLQFKTHLDVFLAANTSESTCDFNIKGSYFERACTIFHGSSNNVIVAQMKKHHTLQSIALGKDTFGVTVYPYVDYAFIVALIVILDEINKDRDDDD
ncbi:protein LURP-one-related 10-like [Iris pallida]|uniref:Protein LURP-one-related 10-like n=1 Tax=Iris pallida TaxID=29817 RepID=A0AAX6HMI9_IRIPA|nr:protein LURP-one-related 10-like [Iris pallida]KAJ6841797.1 protein LURP-one-related 10-like [Iris pallida]